MHSNSDDSRLELGLDGELPSGPEPQTIRGAELDGPGEVWAHRAGIKPVVFLTVRDEDVDRTLRWFEGAHVERRDRRVHVEPGDKWVDDRRRGEPRVELYISADADLAKEACALQSEGNPSRSTLRLGELMGYPPCCAAAFHAQRDRSDNVRNRYETASRTRGHPWSFELDNLVMMLVQFFPCSYLCPRATQFARATLGAIRSGSPHADRIEELLRRPILYFGQEALVAFDGTSPAPGVIEYDRALVPSRAPSSVRRLASALAVGDRLALDEEVLRVTRGGEPRFELRRIDRRLGFVAPFA